MAHTTRLSRAQQLAVLTSNPHSGILTGPIVTLRSLAERGIADSSTAYGPYRLTDSGTVLKTQLSCPVPDMPVAYGNGSGQEPDPARARFVESAWKAMLDHRTAYAPKGEPSVWERLQPVRAAAIILEAAGAVPSATDEYGRRCRPGYNLAVASMMPWAARVAYLLPSVWTEVGHPQRRESTEIGRVLATAYEKYADAFRDAGWHTSPRRSGFSGNTWLIARPAPAV
ncbi:hypothetical protein ACFZAM_31955 [Streptomyces sp. NPDC008079]|uniref:hypothetical protein n=1 Tax=Streptomyces sp. NPDC008079 TaxID=3364806 RepID=UPI0036E414F1